MHRNADFLLRNTGLGIVTPESADHLPRPPDLIHYPWIGLCVGILAAGFFLPLSALALPSEIAILLTMVWQCTLTGYRPETGLFSHSASRPAALHVRQVTLLVLLLLVKFSVLRQFFQDETARLFLFSGITAYCIPVFYARAIGAPSGDGPPASKFALPLAWAVWLASIVWICSPEVYSGGGTAASLRPVLAVAVAGTLSWLLMLDGKKRFRTADGPWGAEIFAGSLAAECGAMVTLLAARHVFQ